MSRTSVLPAGLHLEGTIDGKGDLLIAGTVTGPVTVEGSLVIEDGGRVEGDVRAESLVVRGVLAGSAEARETIRVEPSAVVVGDATAPRVSIQEGAKVRGKVRMSGEPLVPKSVRRRRSRSERERDDRPREDRPRSARRGEPKEGGPGRPQPEAIDAGSAADTVVGRTAPEVTEEKRPRPRRKKRRRGRRPPPPTIPSVPRQKVRRKDRQDAPNPA